eukprot:IDg10308t1
MIRHETVDPCGLGLYQPSARQRSSKAFSGAMGDEPCATKLRCADFAIGSHLCVQPRLDRTHRVGPRGQLRWLPNVPLELEMHWTHLRIAAFRAAVPRFVTRWRDVLVIRAGYTDSSER